MLFLPVLWNEKKKKKGLNLNLSILSKLLHKIVEAVISPQFFL